MAASFSTFDQWCVMSEERLDQATKQINESEINNAVPLDKAILTISSAALALSLTFSKDIVPLKTAVATS